MTDPSTRPRRAGRDSAGVVLYRQGAQEVEVLLVHPSGWYNRRSPWSIPKGLPEDGETLEQAAVRETLEETGVVVDGALVAFDFVTYKNGKRVHAFCAASPTDAVPACASWEVDEARFFPLSQARDVLHVAQQEFIGRLEQHLMEVAPEA